MSIPFLKPNPPRLSGMKTELAIIEDSGIYSNFGPQNALFEARALELLFSGIGSCCTVNNATTGLMLAIKEAIGPQSRPEKYYAAMPSFTFAATAHAALWCGLTPLLYDIEPDTWLPSREAEKELLDRYGKQIAVMVPYATFGNSLDLQWYNQLADHWGIPVVIDAAASLGSGGSGQNFGIGSRSTIVFSMHVTKTFATLEGGLIYSVDSEKINRIRCMSNFGFTEPRVAHLPGLNGKLPEVNAALASAKLVEISNIITKRSALYDQYKTLLPRLTFQKLTSPLTAHQFLPLRLPDSLAEKRGMIQRSLSDAGIGSARYFSPHLAEHPHFKSTAFITNLTTTNMVSETILSLPLYDSMTPSDVRLVCGCLHQAIESA